MYGPSLLTRFTVAVLLLAVIGVGAWRISATGSGNQTDTEVRVAVRPLTDGRTEVAIQQRTDVGWGEYISPEARFLRPNSEPGRWYHSSPVAVAVEPTGPGPLKIALLQTIHGSPVERRRAFKLAIAHINEAGGVFGRPVIGVIADFNLDEDFIVASAKRLVLEDGVHAFVGPTFSSSSLIISERVSNPLKIPTVSPSASSPLLTDADPGDFFFRTTPSDGAGEGGVLAGLAREQGHERIAILYRDDAWGQGLTNEVLRAFEGESVALPIDHATGVSFLSEISEVAEFGASVLLVHGCWKETAVVIDESLRNGLFDQFLLGDCAQSGHLFEALGAEIATGLTGAAPTIGEPTASTRMFVDGFTAMWGVPPPANVSFVPSVYDATIALALAAQAAQSTDGAAIRDQLRTISDGRGVAVNAAMLAEAFEALAEGRDVDYAGAVSSLDWDEHGDLTRFTLGIWRFTADGEIEIVRRIPVDLAP